VQASNAIGLEEWLNSSLFQLPHSTVMGKQQEGGTFDAKSAEPHGQDNWRELLPLRQPISWWAYGTPNRWGTIPR